MYPCHTHSLSYFGSVLGSEKNLHGVRADLSRIAAGDWCKTDTGETKKESQLGREKCDNFYGAGHMETDPLTVVYH